MSLRIRLPAVRHDLPVRGTVVSSSVPLLRAGDSVEFRLHADEADRGTIRVHGREYPVGNLHFLSDLHGFEEDSGGRDTLVVCELAD